jgi:hypothetical protein
MLNTRTRSVVLPQLAAAGVLFLASAGALAAQSFEGALTMVMNPGKDQQVATMVVKGKAVRMDMQAASGLGGMITTADGKTLMLMPAQKQYMVVVQNLQAVAAAAAKKAGTWKATPLNTSASYAGTKCDWYRLSRGTEKGMEMCIATGLGDLGSRDQGGVTEEDLRVLRSSFPKGFFPMAAREPGSDKMTFTVTKVERRAVSASEVAVPKGWTEMKTPSGR